MNEWRIQYDAVLRLNLYTVGKTHAILNRAVQEMRGLVLGAADSGGNLTPLKLADIRRELDASLDRSMTRWQNLTRNARREAAAIPFGTMRAQHRYFFGTVARGVAEALITEAGKRGGKASSRNANANADGVFNPQIASVMKAAERDYSGGLSNKIWQTSQEARNGVNRVLFSGVQNGKSAYDIAKDLEQYLGPGQDCPRWTRTRLYNRTKKQIAAGDRGGLITGNPCGSKGVAYKALRVARTEVQRVHNEATTQAMRDLPWVEEEQINLSPAHPVEDICDDIIARGRDGKGIYPIGEIKLPIHPNCAPAGEMVATEFGPTPIESVLPGVRVLTHTGNMREVTGIMSREYSGGMVSIVTKSGVSALMTSEHPVWSETRQAWVNAADIQYGEKVAVADEYGSKRSDHVHWRGIEPVKCEVFNISVESDESYFLSGLLTHNCLCYMTAVDMPTDDFVGNLAAWVRGGSWDAMDQYAAKYGPAMDPPIAPLTSGGTAGRSGGQRGAGNNAAGIGIAVGVGVAVADIVADLLTPDGVQNIDALDDWLGADEATLDRRMGWDEEE